MFIKALISLALAGSALATPTQVYERDLPTVTNALASINSAATALDSAVNSFSGASDVPNLQTLGSALLSAINSANSQIAASAQLSLTDAIGLQSASGGLTTGAQTLVNDIIAKKPAFDAACISPAILAQLESQKTASQTLANTIVSKLPTELQSLGQSQSGGVVDAVNKGIAAYQGSTSCSSSSGSATTSAAAAPPASTAAASSAAASSAAAAPSSAAAPPPSGYGSGSATSSSSSPTTPTASPSASSSKTTPTPSPSGSSIVPYTGAAAPQQVATGLMSVAAIAAIFAIAL